MICLSIKPEWIEGAKIKSKELGILNRSFMKGEGNITGFIGEYMVADYLRAEFSNTHDYDLIRNGIKIDVKTKRCTSPPRPDYECSVSTYYKQMCNFYIFCRVLTDYSQGWILGIIKRDDFFKKAKMYKKGTRDPSNGMVFKADSWNLEISKLLDIEKLIKERS